MPIIQRQAAIDRVIAANRGEVVFAFLAAEDEEIADPQ